MVNFWADITLRKVYVKLKANHKKVSKEVMNMKSLIFKLLMQDWWWTLGRREKVTLDSFRVYDYA